MEYKRPESVLVVVYTVAGEVLLLRRVQPSGFWQSVTGSLRWGESASRAAERELYEETGLRASGRLRDCRHTERFPIRFPWRVRYAPNARYNREHWFQLQLQSRRHARLNPDEHDRQCWLPVHRAARMVGSWTNRKAILDLLRTGPL